MNDKQQLAAMGEHLAEQAEQAEQTKQEAQPLCMAKRIEELEAQVRVMAGLLRELREGAEIHLHNCTVCKNEQGIANWTSKLERIDAALSGKLPDHAEQQSAMESSASDLTADEALFLAWACAFPGSKNEDIAWGNETEGVTEPLWKKLESIGLIECVGSYKWKGTDKGRAMLAAALKPEAK